MSSVYRVGCMVLDDRLEKMDFFEKRERAKEYEITSFNNKIQATFNTSITHTWIPTNFKKGCLSIKVHNQDILMNEKDDFELELYLALKEALHKSNFFDMVALM